jgi:hypothetical protein
MGTYIKSQQTRITKITIPLKVNLRVRITLLAVHVIPMDIPLSLLQTLTARQRRQPVLVQQQLSNILSVLLEVLGQALLLALLLGSHERLASGLANEFHPRLDSAADAKERDLVGLSNDGKLRVVAAVVALPVRVVGNVAGGECDRIGILEGVVRAGGRVAVVGVERDTVGAVRVNREGASDAFPDAGRLKSMLLKELLAPVSPF